MNVEDFVKHFENVKRSPEGWSARCPGHEDKTNSLTIKEGDDGRILLHDFAGCQTETILAIKRLGWADIFPEREGREKVEVGAYQYRDEKGKVLYEVVRFHPKDFRQRRPDPDKPGQWIWRLDTTRRVPYRLQELLAAPKDHIVFIVEGEKDVNLLRARGYVATTSPGGAGKWLDAYSEHFEGRRVVILPDNDKPGKEHAKAVKKSLLAYRPAYVEVCLLPGLPEKGDVSDWFNAGNTPAMFDDFVREVFDEVGSERAALVEEHEIHAQEAHGKEFWTPTELVENSSIVFPDGFLHGEIFPRGTVSMIYGASSSGKSYLVMYLGAQIALHRPVHGLETAPGRVLFLSEEMGMPEMKLRSEVVWDRETRQALRDRMRNKFFSGFDFGGKERDNPSVHKFAEICGKVSPDIVFIDSLTKIHHEEENSNPRMGQVMQNLEAAARMANVAIVLVHHTAKANPEAERSGKDKARGASAIIAAMNDALLVECISSKDLKSVVSFEKTRSVIGSPPPPFLFTQEQDPSGRTVKVKKKVIPAVQFLIGDYVKKDRLAEEAIKEVRAALEGLVGERMEDGSTTDEVVRVDLVARLRTENPEWTDNRCDQAITRAVVRKLIERRARGIYGPIKN